MNSLNAATMELCLTSNRCLVGMEPTEHLCAEFVRNPFSRAVLATDDPDVFGPACTLRGELALAHESGLFDEEGQLELLLEESMYGSFADDETVHKVAERVAGLSRWPQVRGRPVEADPKPEILRKIERLIEYDKPHKAIDEIWKIDSAYRRSQALKHLSRTADEALRDLHAREGFPRSYGDWTPPIYGIAR